MGGAQRYPSFAASGMMGFAGSTHPTRCEFTSAFGGIADLAGLDPGLIRSRMTQSRAWAADRLGRNVCQPYRVLADQVAGHKAERWPRASEEWLAAAKHDGVKVESILINKTKVG
jgi:hypothetical protein